MVVQYSHQRFDKLSITSRKYQFIRQSFHGDSNLSWKNKGVATRFRTNKLFFVPCTCIAMATGLISFTRYLTRQCCAEQYPWARAGAYNLFNRPKCLVILKDIEGENIESFITLKSFSETHWSCRWE